jgi:hypothetical protein
MYVVLAKLDLSETCILLTLFPVLLLSLPHELPFRNRQQPTWVGFLFLSKQYASGMYILFMYVCIVKIYRKCLVQKSKVPSTRINSCLQRSSNIAFTGEDHNIEGFIVA